MFFGELTFFITFYVLASMVYTGYIIPFRFRECKNFSINSDKIPSEFLKTVLKLESLENTVKISSFSAEEKPQYSDMYCEKTHTIDVQTRNLYVKDAQSYAICLHECGHAIQYNKNQSIKTLIKIRDILNIGRGIDTVSCIFYYVFSAMFLDFLAVICLLLTAKLFARVIISYFIEYDANVKTKKYIDLITTDRQAKLKIIKFLAVSASTYLVPYPIYL